MPRKNRPPRPPDVLRKGHVHSDKRTKPRHRRHTEEDMSEHTVRDQLTNADPLKVYQAGYQMVNAMQDYEPGVQVAASALLFLAMADEFKVCMKATLESVDRMTEDMNESEHWQSTKLRDALRDYIHHEIGRHL